MNNAPAWIEQMRHRVNQALEASFTGLPQTELHRAAQYVLLGGGHRWRALMAVAAGELFSADAERIVLPIAGALEMMHAASLVLDDRPSMDNASVRREKPCAHIVFPTWVVDMLPAFLVNQAYWAVAGNQEAAEGCRIRGLILFGEMGASLAHGQEQDLELLTRTVSEEDLLERHALKSGSLFAAALAGGGLLCGAGPSDAQALREAGLTLGQAYQILDDITDGTDGPHASEDAGRCTALTLLGREGALARVRELRTDVLRVLDRFGPAAGSLRELSNQILRTGHPDSG